jgi:hypothetical protein
MSKQLQWRKIVAALLLAAALTGLPVLAANGAGPLAGILAQPVYACPISGDCG